MVVVTKPELLSWLRKKSIIIAIFISLAGGIYNHIFGDTEAITEAKQYCMGNIQILSITGKIKSISLKKITQYNGSGKYSAYKEYKFDIHGDMKSIMVLLQVEYANGLNNKPSKFTLVDIIK